MDLVVLVIASLAMSVLALVLIIINSIKIHKLTLGFKDHCGALDIIYELFELQKDINCKIKRTIRKSEGCCRINATIIDDSFRTKPDQAPIRRGRKPKCSPNEQDMAKKSTKTNKTSTKNCVK